MKPKDDGYDSLYFLMHLPWFLKDPDKLIKFAQDCYPNCDLVWNQGALMLIVSFLKCVGGYVPRKAKTEHRLCNRLKYSKV